MRKWKLNYFGLKKVKKVPVVSKSMFAKQFNAYSIYTRQQMALTPTFHIKSNRLKPVNFLQNEQWKGKLSN